MHHQMHCGNCVFERLPKKGNNIKNVIVALLNIWRSVAPRLQLNKGLKGATYFGQTCTNESST